ncbi:hypothetical protein GCM10023186_00320 [Hymenobacter koreensis]|uniref:Uncharacterized protein n=1 Tax=Hymenobacter koreensis TaxID=1084523 RepID=A0ABP8ITZ5_9BACT
MNGVFSKHHAQGANQGYKREEVEKGLTHKGGREGEENELPSSDEEGWPKAGVVDNRCGTCGQLGLLSNDFNHPGAALAATSPSQMRRGA